MIALPREVAIFVAERLEISGAGVMPDAQLAAAIVERCNVPSPEAPAIAERRRVAMALVGYWRDTCGHPQAKPKGRVEKVIARLRDGYSEELIRQAINGAAAFPYVRDGARCNIGNARERFDDLELICRNAVKLDRFIALGESVEPRRALDQKLIGE